MSERRIVKHDPATGMSPLFRPLPALKAGQRQKLDVRTEHSGVELHWRGPDALGIPEETLLLVILEKLGNDQELFEASAILAPSSDSDVGKTLWTGLATSGSEQSGDTMVLFTSFAALCRACGHDSGGAAIRQVKTMLKRLVEVTLWLRRGRLEGSSRLISWMVCTDGQVAVAVNRRLAAAIQGAHYCQVSLSERLALPTHTAQALHARLSAQIREGWEMRYRMESLERMVWGINAEGSTQRNRFAKLRSALSALGGLRGWEVSDAPGRDGNRVYRIRRVSAKYADKVTSSEKRRQPLGKAATTPRNSDDGGPRLNPCAAWACGSERHPYYY